MVFGEERLFIIEYPPDPLGIKEFILKYRGWDQYGLKMKGDFPEVWTIETDKVHGPLLFEENGIYKAVMLDYDNHLIWLAKVFKNL